jgi:tetratricopeptide (TPR) repeat protein
MSAWSKTTHERKHLDEIEVNDRALQTYRRPAMLGVLLLALLPAELLGQKTTKPVPPVTPRTPYTVPRRNLTGFSLPNQPYETLKVRIHSENDDVLIYRGHVDCLVQILKPQEDYPRVELGPGPNAILRILDLSRGTATRTRQAWEVLLFPTAPASFEMEFASSSVDIDFTDMPVQQIDVKGSSNELTIRFDSRNSTTLADLTVASQRGKLRLLNILYARPERVLLNCPATELELDFGHHLFGGEFEVVVEDVPRSIEVVLPRTLGVRVEAPNGALSKFSSSHLTPRNGWLESRGYNVYSCRVRFLIHQTPEKLEVHWEGHAPDYESSTDIAKAPDLPNEVAETANAPDARVSRFLAYLDEGRVKQAQSELERITAAETNDQIVQLLDRLIANATARTVQSSKAPAESEAKKRFNNGLNFYVQGQLDRAIEEFRFSLEIDPSFDVARRWIKKTRSEIRRLNASMDRRESDQPPAVVEKIVTVSAAPVFAVQNPRSAFTTIRSSSIEVFGQINDDLGIARVEVTLNGEPVVEPDGDLLNVLPDTLVSDRKRVTFSANVPLRKGENQIVLTAYDEDSTPHWTAEQLTVHRKPPIVQTGAFRLSLAGLVVIVASTFLITRWVKYRLAIVNRYNPYIAGLPIRNPEMMFGRERIIRHIMNTIDNNSITLFGPRRIGKTSVLLALRERLSSARGPEYRNVPVFVDLQGVPEQRLFHTMLSEIAHVCRRELDRGSFPRLDLDQEDYTTLHFSQDFHHLLRVLKRDSSKTVRVVLLIDEVDQLNKYSEQTNQKLRSVFMRASTEALVAVMAGTYIRKDWEAESSPWYNFFEEVEVRALEREDAVRLISKPVQGIFSYDREAIDRIIDYSDCQPYLVQRYCVHVINRIIDNKRRRAHASDVDAVKGELAEVT